jgi:DNA-binding CsgD family transcriptional regulator
MSMQRESQDIINNLMSLSGFVSDLCRPIFEQTSIKSFGYIEIFENGQVLQLESNPEIYKILLQQPGSYSSPANVLNYHNKPGVIICDFEQEGYLPELYQNIAKDFNLAHLMIMIELHQEPGCRSLRYFAFSSEKGKETMHTLYVNLMDDLKSFAHYFANRVHKHFKDVPKIKQNIFSDEEFTKRFESFFNDEEECLFKNEIPCPHHIGKTQIMESPLSEREQEIIDYYVKGFNSKETAKLLNVSNRTIDRHFENIRKKLNVKTKREILIALDEYGNY